MFQEAIDKTLEKIDNMTGEEIYNWLLDIGFECEDIED